MSRAYDCTVMFMIKSGATEIDESDVGSFHASRVPPLKKKDLFLKHFRMKVYPKRRIFGFDRLIIILISRYRQ